MGGWISFAICLLAAYRLNVGAHSGTAASLGIVVAVANLWSFGVMHNYRHDPESAPNFWTNINLATTLLGLGLLIYSFFA